MLIIKYRLKRIDCNPPMYWEENWRHDGWTIDRKAANTFDSEVDLMEYLIDLDLRDADDMISESMRGYEVELEKVIILSEKEQP